MQTSTHIIGAGFLGFVVVKNMDILTQTFLTLSILCSGLGILLLGATVFMGQNKQEAEPEESEYNIFIKKHYHTMKDIMKDPDIQQGDYEQKSEAYIASLKEVAQHYEVLLPFLYNSKVIMFYHEDEKSFHYYIQRGDVNYPVLNTICREYVIEKRCFQLFQDDHDLKYIQQLIKDEDGDYEHVDTQEEESGEEEEEENDEKEEEKSTQNSIFYFKKFEQKEKKRVKQDKVIHSFIRKGNLEDYKVDFPNNESNESSKCPPKKVDYNSFKASIETEL